MVLGLLVSGCGDIYQEMIYQTRYINRALAPYETTHLMGRQCVCYDNKVAGTSGIRNNLIEFEDDKLGWIRYYFEFETSQTSNIFALGSYKIYTATYKGYEYIDFGIWKMNRRGTIIINGDKKNTMRFHLKEEVYKDNKLFVKIKNADYPEGKFFKINLILKDSSHRNMQ